MTAAADTKVLYTANTHTTGGRDGRAQSSDSRLDVALSVPGSPGAGTNPEQLFAAGWSACFIGAMRRAAAVQKVTLPAISRWTPRSIWSPATTRSSCGRA